MKKTLVGIGLVLFSLTGIAQKGYVISSMKGSRVPIVEAKSTNSLLVQMLDKYKEHLDREMGVVVGVAQEDLKVGQPESLLTNLTADVMKQLDEEYSKGKVDLAVMNVHGHRSYFPKGNITVGHIFEVYSFDNALSVVRLKGSDLTDLFNSYAKIGGSGISSNVRLVISNGQLVSATVDGQSVDPSKVYTIVTLDYLADGNDDMDAFKKAISVEPTGIILRDYMTKYITEQTKEGKNITSKLDGRIVNQ